MLFTIFKQHVISFECNSTPCKSQVCNKFQSVLPPELWPVWCIGINFFLLTIRCVNPEIFSKAGRLFETPTMPAPAIITSYFKEKRKSNYLIQRKVFESFHFIISTKYNPASNVFIEIYGFVFCFTFIIIWPDALYIV